MELKDQMDYLIKKGFTVKDNNIYSFKGKLLDKDRIAVNDKQHCFMVNRKKFIHYYNTGNILYTIPRPSRKINKTIASVPNVISVKRLPYIKDDELIYHIIISKGKGYLTSEATTFLISIAHNLIKKFNYNDYDDMLDCRQEAIYQMVKNYMLFDERKYSSALPYFSEICKRAMAKSFNKIRGQRSSYDTFVPKMISLSNFKQ